MTTIKMCYYFAKILLLDKIHHFPQTVTKKRKENHQQVLTISFHSAQNRHIFMHRLMGSIHFSQCYLKNETDITIIFLSVRKRKKH